MHLVIFVLLTASCLQVALTSILASGEVSPRLVWSCYGDDGSSYNYDVQRHWSIDVRRVTAKRVLDSRGPSTLAYLGGGTRRVWQQKQFTGKERDAETGLDYFGARYFSGAQGRFTSPDPFSILQEAGSREELDEFLSNPQHWNKYAYSLNNPLKYVDPDGNHPILIQIAQALQRAANSPAGQRAINYASTQGTRLYNAATQFFNSPAGQELTQSAIEAVSGVPLGTSISPRSALAREINAALSAGSAGTQLEGQVARALFSDVVSFKREIFSAGKRVGEIDVELKNAIIDITTAANAKAGQIARYVSDAALNPQGKAVIVFGPNLTRGAARAIEQTGARVVRNLDELKKILKDLDQ